MRLRDDSASGTWIDTTSLAARRSSRSRRSAPAAAAAASVRVRLHASTRMPYARPSPATCLPRRPSPTSPRVLPQSTGVSGVGHSPRFSPGVALGYSTHHGLSEADRELGRADRISTRRVRDHDAEVRGRLEVEMRGMVARLRDHAARLSGCESSSRVSFVRSRFAISVVEATQRGRRVRTASVKTLTTSARSRRRLDALRAAPRIVDVIEDCDAHDEILWLSAERNEKEHRDDGDPRRGSWAGGGGRQLAHELGDIGQRLERFHHRERVLDPAGASTSDAQSVNFSWSSSRVNGDRVRRDIARRRARPACGRRRDRLRRCCGSCRSPAPRSPDRESVSTLRHHRLHRRAAHELVGELVDAGLAPQRDAPTHERGAELRLELGLARSDSAAGSGCSSPRAREWPDLLRLARRARSTSLRIASIVGWPSTPHGYGLIETPGLDDRVRVPELADDAIGVEPPPKLKTWKKPHGRIERVWPPVKPRAASSAAMTPFCAARPTCSGLVIVPKLTRMPARDARRDRERVRDCSASSSSSFAAAAAAPNVPTVPDEWNPFL